MCFYFYLVKNTAIAIFVYSCSIIKDRLLVRPAEAWLCTFYGITSPPKERINRLRYNGICFGVKGRVLQTALTGGVALQGL